MDVTGNTSDTNNMLSGTKGTAANGTSVTGTIVATPVDDTLSTTSHNAIENAAVATALASKADSSAIPDSTSDLTNDSNFISDSSYVHTDNNFTTTLKNKLDGIATNATVDDHKWNDVTLTKSTSTTSNNIYVPYMTSTSGTGANLATASTTPTAHYIAKYDANKRLYSTTPTAGDDSTKVATTAFVQSAISALGSVLNYKGTKSTISNLPTTGNITGDVWIVTADSSEHVWNGSAWEQLGTTVDLSGYALASSVPDSTSDLTNDSGFLTSSDLPSWSQASTKPSYTASEVGAATSSHVHGNITNGGDITGNVAIASGDRLVINDESASKINNSSITFGSSTTTFLANNGTWQTPSGVVTSVNGSTGAVTITAANIQAVPTTTSSATGSGTISHSSGNISIAEGNSMTGSAELSLKGPVVTISSTKELSDSSIILKTNSTNNIVLSEGTTTITGVVTPVNNTDAANKQYVDSTVSGIVFPVTSVNGSTGAVTVSVPAASTTTPSMDGTASYGSGTDYARANHIHPSDTTKVSKSGDTMTGNLTFNSTKGITFTGASYQSTLSFNGGGSQDGVTYITGGFSNPVQISGIKNPVQSDHIANKNYVDSSYVIAGKLDGTILGNNSTAEGRNVTSSGVASHAEGDKTVASANFSHAEGDTTTASNYASHAENYNTTASGNYSHAEGSYTTASGTASHAEGQSVTASGIGSHAEGYNTNATHARQHVFGRYNISDPSEAASTAYGTYVEIVGNGSSSNYKSNARTLDWDGNEVLAGKLTVGADPTSDMDVATKKYVSSATVRPNLLRNWYFLGTGTTNGNLPVNQQGQTSYTGGGYGLDGWYLRNAVTTTLTSTGLLMQFPSGNTDLKGMNQSFENIQDFLGKTVTLSVLVTSFTSFGSNSYPRFGLYAANSALAHSSSVVSEVINGTGLFTITGTIPDSLDYSRLNFTPCYANTLSGSIKIAAAKFEIGNTQTLAHQENNQWILNEIPDYQTELMRCLTYSGLGGVYNGWQNLGGKVTAQGYPYIRMFSGTGEMYQWAISSNGSLLVQKTTDGTNWTTLTSYAPQP